MQPETGILVSIEEPWVCPLPELDLRELRARYADLIDRATEKLMRTGYDLDDVEIVRMLRCRDDTGRETAVEARWLADVARLQKEVAETIGACGYGRIVVRSLAVSIVHGRKE